jgi:hypothetical protein
VTKPDSLEQKQLNSIVSKLVSNETMKRLFSLMEKYGERIEYIEKQM